MATPVSIISTFDGDIEGWSISGDAASFGWQSSGGSPGGHLGWVDAATGSDAYWEAGAQFTGNLKGFYGGTFSYAIEESSSPYSGVPDVEIIGGGLTLVATAGQPGTDWTHLSVALTDAGGWHVSTLSGAAATAAQIKQALGDVTQILVRAEYVSGPESGGLDSVALVGAGGTASAWNVFSAHAGGDFENAYATFGQAQNAADAGRLFDYADLTGAGLDLGKVGIHLENVAVEGDANLAAKFKLGDGVTSFSLMGETNASVTCNGLGDIVVGSDGDNKIVGGAGADVIYGGAGHDVMSGGGGADAFAFTGLNDSLPGASRDVINGFVSGTDSINFHGLDPNLTWMGTAAFDHNHPDGEVRWEVRGSDVMVQVDLDGDRHADLEIRLSGINSLSQFDVVF